MNNPFRTPDDYELFLYTLRDNYRNGCANMSENVRSIIKLIITN